jgi:hypothetical protein
MSIKRGSSGWSRVLRGCSQKGGFASGGGGGGGGGSGGGSLLAVAGVLCCFSEDEEEDEDDDGEGDSCGAVGMGCAARKPCRGEGVRCPLEAARTDGLGVIAEAGVVVVAFEVAGGDADLACAVAAAACGWAFRKPSSDDRRAGALVASLSPTAAGAIGFGAAV